MINFEGDDNQGGHRDGMSSPPLSNHRHSPQASAPLPADHRSRSPVSYELPSNARSEPQMHCATGDAAQFQ